MVKISFKNDKILCYKVLCAEEKSLCALKLFLCVKKGDTSKVLP